MSLHLPEFRCPSADQFLVEEGGETHFPSAGTLARMTTGRLLELMEEYELMAEERPRLAGSAVEAVTRIATTLAHRLGIHCDRYIAVMCDNGTAAEWRTLFPADPGPASAGGR